MDAAPAAREVATGTERFTLELLPRLPEAAPELLWTFYSSRPAARLDLDLTVLPMPRLWSQLRLPVELWRTRPNLTLVPAHAVPFAVPGVAIGVVHDLAFERFPEAYRPAELAYLRLTTRWAGLRCRRLLAISEATRRDLLELHGVPGDRVQVIHPGGGEPPGDGLALGTSTDGLARLGVRVPFVLTVGRVEPRKNQLAALAAVEQLDGLQLVAAGPVRDGDMAGRLSGSSRCRLLGHVSQADLELLYARASALLVSSLYEGFGFTVLEAMRRGLPVVCGRVASLPEVAGEAAEYVADPRDAVALAAALARLVGDDAHREAMIERGRRQAARFTWERCAQEVVEVIRSELAQPPPPLRSRPRSGWPPAPR